MTEHQFNIIAALLIAIGSTSISAYSMRNTAQPHWVTYPIAFVGSFVLALLILEEFK